jgi:hypothetical protein
MSMGHAVFTMHGNHADAMPLSDCTGCWLLGMSTLVQNGSHRMGCPCSHSGGPPHLQLASWRPRNNMTKHTLQVYRREVFYNGKYLATRTAGQGGGCPVTMGLMSRLLLFSAVRFWPRPPAIHWFVGSQRRSGRRDRGGAGAHSSLVA